MKMYQERVADIDKLRKENAALRATLADLRKEHVDCATAGADAGVDADRARLAVMKMELKHEALRQENAALRAGAAGAGADEDMEEDMEVVSEKEALHQLNAHLYEKHAEMEQHIAVLEKQLVLEMKKTQMAKDLLDPLRTNMQTESRKLNTVQDQLKDLEYVHRNLRQAFENSESINTENQSLILRLQNKNNDLEAELPRINCC
jgi:chromosome segregation ATPase